MNMNEDVLSGKNVSDFRVVHHIFEAGIKLEAQAQTIATAATLYHSFFRESSENYDKYLIAATAMYLAGKVEEDHMKIRDVINVFHRILHPAAEPLECGQQYWALRDSIVQSELLVMRMLQFKVSFDHPHKYLLVYLKSICDWMDPTVVKSVPLAPTCWSLLNDFFHDAVCLKHKPQHVAIAIIHIALQCYAINVPYNDDAVMHWYEVFCEDINKDKIWEILEDVLSVYDHETEIAA